MKFIQGKPVVDPNRPEDVFRLHVTVMHGDGDHYDEKTTDFKADLSTEYFEATLIDCIKALQSFLSLEWNEQCRVIRDGVYEFLESVNPEKSKDIGDLWSENMVGQDVTDHQGYSARPEKYWVTYFDKNGIEYDITIEE